MASMSSRVDHDQLDRLPHGYPDSELIHALEPDQIVEITSRPLPRYRLSPVANLGLGCCVFLYSSSVRSLYTPLSQRSDKASGSEMSDDNQPLIR